MNPLFVQVSACLLLLLLNHNVIVQASQSNLADTSPSMLNEIGPDSSALIFERHGLILTREEKLGKTIWSEQLL